MDASTDGKFTDYLSEPSKWKKYDPPLYQELVSLINENNISMDFGFRVKTIKKFKHGVLKSA